MSAPAFEGLLTQAAALSLDFLRSQDERHVGARASRDELEAALGGSLASQGEDPASVLARIGAQAERGAIASGSPRYFGFVIGGSHPVAMASDWLVTALDQNAGIHATSPWSAVIEQVAARWALELFDLPREASVGFVTGCQMANFTCLAAARHALLARSGWDVEADGLAGAPAINIVTSAESHVTVDVALRYLGFGTRRALRVDTDGQGRMRADRLRDLLATRSGPTLVCAQAGNVNTGAFDPLDAITDVTRAHGAWLHVDAAFGLWARASRARASLAAGAEHADSWATDAHKWLNVPYDCGLAIVRDAQAHRDAMTSAAPYLVQTLGPERDAVDWTPEFSRRARGVPVYATLAALGRQGVESLVDRCCDAASGFAHGLSGEPGVRVLNEVVLNQVLVRFGDDDALTRRVVADVQDQGVCWLSGTTWHGQAAMRISVSNWQTGADDVRRSVESILQAYRGLR